MPKLSSTVEDYLSLIFVLERDREPVVGARLAELLDVSPPTVTNTLKRMARDGLVSMGKQGARLTRAGRDSARTVTRRHMLTEWMMVERLPWSRLHQEAHNLEHAISGVVIRRIHELAEQNIELMDFLEGKGIMPGKQALVSEVLPFNQTIALTIGQESATLSFASARHLFVERLPSADGHWTP
jgi:DtxR family Mn-dependent transcriptional regulator